MALYGVQIIFGIFLLYDALNLCEEPNINKLMCYSVLTSFFLQEFPNSSWSQFMIIIYHHFYFHLGTLRERGKQNPRFSPNTPIQVVILAFHDLETKLVFHFYKQRSKVLNSNLFAYSITSASDSICWKV